MKIDEKTRELYKEILKKRKEIQPLNYPNSGSIFKNIEGKKAYQVIREIGLVDELIGGAKFSEKHANFIVNVNKCNRFLYINVVSCCLPEFIY